MRAEEENAKAVGTIDESDVEMSDAGSGSEWDERVSRYVEESHTTSGMAIDTEISTYESTTTASKRMYLSTYRRELE